LSSANAQRQGLAGPNSSLFYEVVRIKRTVQAEVGSHIVVKYVVENVASMKREECDTISEKLQREPYFLNPVDAVPMNRPRLCWTSEVLENVMEGITITQKSHWREITASAPYPELDQWVEPGVNWPGYEWGSTLPTAMKAIKRSKPPFRPAGIEKCDQDTLERYSADDFRYPPYQYQWKYIFFTSNGTWRTASAEEKELLLWYGWRHTALCYSASEIKQSRQAYDDQRHSLLGDSFSIFSFIIPAVGLCHEFFTPNILQMACYTNVDGTRISQQLTLAMSSG
jgi:site-specific DNA-cytosine methylase